MMMRTFLVAASMMLLFVAVAAAQKQAQQAEKARRESEQLRSPIPVAFDGVPLGRLEAYFSNVVGTPIAFDWASLEPFGVDRETPVRLTMPNLPASSAMQLAIYAAIAAADAPPPELTQLRIVPARAAEGLKVSVARVGAHDEKGGLRSE